MRVGAPKRRVRIEPKLKPAGLEVARRGYGLTAEEGPA